jgi:hypothetical protein
LGYEVKDLPLPVGKSWEDLRLRGGHGAREVGEHPFCDGRAEDRFSFAHSPDREYHLLLLGVFEDVPARAPALKAMNTESSSSKRVTTRMRMLGLS